MEMAQTNEERAAKKRAYYQANKERISAYDRSYREANKEKIAARQRAHRRVLRLDPAEKQKRSEQYKSYYKTARGRMVGLRSRAKTKGVAFNLPIEFFGEIPDHCPQCDRKLCDGTAKSRISVDRESPDLGYVVGNCEWICMGCNIRKQDHTWQQMQEFATRGLDRLAARRMLLGKEQPT